MRISIVLVLSVISTACLAQKVELSSFCNQLDKSLANRAYRVLYTLSVKARENNSKPESVTMHLYRDGEKQKMVVGDYQEIIQEQELTLVVNHVMKEITLQKEKSANPDQLLIKGLSALVDSARSVQVSEQSGLRTFTLLYPEDFVYTKLQITISKKSNEMKVLYAEFSPKHPDGYHSLRVTYELWEKDWKPEVGFPNMSKYLIKSGKKYALQSGWNRYKFYQPQSGTLKL